MLAGDAPRPVSTPVVPKGLRFAQASEWVAQYVLDQRVDAREDFRVLLPPPEVVFPRLVGPAGFTGKSALSRVFPASMLRIALFSRLAFRGLRMR